MSPDNPKSNARQQKGAKQDQIQDLKDAKVSEKDAGNVKGGINPQPLPPHANKKLN
jgi:hypothetical protein